LIQAVPSDNTSLECANGGDNIALSRDPAPAWIPDLFEHFWNIIPRLAGNFRVIAPDYPGYGQSSMADHKAFEYSFENLASMVDGFVASLGLKKYSMYVMDYGAPIGSDGVDASGLDRN
jgi:pimeloyl-ACP methyl ester carboxylesterase